MLYQHLLEISEESYMSHSSIKMSESDAKNKMKYIRSGIFNLLIMERNNDEDEKRLQILRSTTRKSHDFNRYDRNL
jgi:hypothetical protein